MYLMYVSHRKLVYSRHHHPHIYLKYEVSSKPSKRQPAGKVAIDCWVFSSGVLPCSVHFSVNVKRSASSVSTMSFNFSRSISVSVEPWENKQLFLTSEMCGRIPCFADSIVDSWGYIREWSVFVCLACGSPL